MFAAGAGGYPGPENYTEACFQTQGSQFRPGKNADPNIGTPGVLERVDEMRVETICLGRGVVFKAVEGLMR